MEDKMLDASIGNRGSTFTFRRISLKEDIMLVAIRILTLNSFRVHSIKVEAFTSCNKLQAVHFISPKDCVNNQPLEKTFSK